MAKEQTRRTRTDDRNLGLHAPSKILPPQYLAMRRKAAESSLADLRERQAKFRRSAKHASQPLFDDRFGIGNDARDQFLTGRDVVDQALDHAGTPNAVLGVAA